MTELAQADRATTGAADRPRRPLSDRKRRLLEQANHLAPARERWVERHAFYYSEDWRYLKFLVPEGRRVLDLGCGTGDLLDALRPSEGVGVDFSPSMIERARARHPGLTFVCADVENLDDVAEITGTFDAIVLSDTIGALDDCQETLRKLHRYCTPQTRVIIAYHSRMWEPLLRLNAALTIDHSVQAHNWLSSLDIVNLFQLADFEVVKRDWRMLCPFHWFGIGRLINRFVATLPVIRKLSLRNFVVARPRAIPESRELSATVMVPCRNERGNIENAVRRLPKFCSDIEVVFVEGGSRDGTWEEIQRVIAAYPEQKIRAFKQTGTGKGDAVRKGFAEARGDVLMILDADLTVPPEDLPKFYDALVDGKGEFVNGTRLVYPMEKQAMRFLNLLANHMFALAFTYLLGQRHTDTLCGTKALRRTSYDEISRNRAYFGDFDPFSDFDLIFGASKLNLKTAEVPIRYAAREYGETQISRFRHGLLLMRMVVFAFFKFKAL